jgi:hypothetical protein
MPGRLGARGDIPRRVTLGLELTGAVELLLFLRVVHLGVEINLGGFERFVSEPILNFHQVYLQDGVALTA